MERKATKENKWIQTERCMKKADNSTQHIIKEQKQNESKHEIHAQFTLHWLDKRTNPAAR